MSEPQEADPCLTSETRFPRRVRARNAPLILYTVLSCHEERTAFKNIQFKMLLWESQNHFNLCLELTVHLDRISTRWHKALITCRKYAHALLPVALDPVWINLQTIYSFPASRLCIWGSGSKHVIVPLLRVVCLIKKKKTVTARIYIISVICSSAPFQFKCPCAMLQFYLFKKKSDVST